LQNPFTQRLTGQRSGSVVKKNGAKIFGLDLNYVLASASSVWPRLRPQATTNKLQRALNVAARVVSGTHKFDRGLSLLLHTELHWLDVPERVVYIQTRRHGVNCLHGQAPQYLVELCQPVAGVASRQHLRSATRQLLVVPRHQLSSYGRRAFCVPSVWNSLPDNLQNPIIGGNSFRRFCSQLTDAIGAFTTMRYINRLFI